jgi:hypothetical protein
MCKAILLSDEQIAKYGYFLDNIERYPVEDGHSIGSVLYFGFDSQELSEDAEKLRNNSVTFFERTEKGFSAEITTTTDQLVFFSVPFDEGWSAKVNGADTEIEQVNVGFMAVFVSAGTSEISFEYETPGLALGIKISILALILLILYLGIFALVNRKSGRVGNKYPEGDKLLQEWKQDIAEEKIKASNEEFAGLIPIETKNESPVEEDLTNEDMYGIGSDFSRGFWITADDEDEE